MEKDYEERRKELSEALGLSNTLRKELDQTKKGIEISNAQLQKRDNEAEKLKSTHQKALEQLQAEISAERTAKMSLGMELRQLQIEHQKLSADLEDLTKSSTPNTKHDKTGSIGKELLLSATVATGYVM